MIFFTQSRLINEIPGVVHAFGGVGFHVSLPVKPRSAMEPARLLGVPPGRIMLLKQVHSGRVVKYDETAQGGWGVVRGDAILCSSRGTGAAILTADCYPVVAVGGDGSGSVIFHAGWRGILGGIVENSIEALTGGLSLSPGDVKVAIGPGASGCCYEVKGDVAGLFKGKHGDCIMQGVDRGFTLDLGKVVLKRLVSSGIEEGNIDMTGTCTICSQDFFSVRREKETRGRQINLSFLI